ncbi:excinuclease ABC subunit UvrC [Litoribacillus peritrichatus]|uniref:UvrABC system protein C n=1 Tax=Litoribacillus peritrichatus TaxID=718191 RepID=A0ABP7N103_9GAMM
MSSEIIASDKQETPPEQSSETPQFDSKGFLKSVTELPGVYRMFDENAELLYVGKAKSLKKRLSSYFRKNGLHIKTRVLVGKIADIQVTVTSSETEALLLEQNLIKKHRPPYNVLLRDDKSYPYVHLSDHKDYPYFSFKRGKKRGKGQFFGPYPSSGAVKESLAILQKLFKVRQCDDSFYKNRSRPCLQHQIKRCSAPCVGLITPERYMEDVRRTSMFLLGKNNEIIHELVEEMEKASMSLDFERAAELRDQVTALRTVQEQQYVMGEGSRVNADVIAIDAKPGGVCISVLYVRSGQVLGNKVYYPKVSLDETESELLATFITQLYITDDATRELPEEIICSHPPNDIELLNAAFSQLFEHQKVEIKSKVRTQKAKWLELSVKNAEQSLQSLLNNKQNMMQRFRSLQDALELDEVPLRLECFDISHSSGEATVASCVVFDQNGPAKNEYRSYNIEGITGGDDYAAMNQALTRRFTKIKKGEGKIPDILVIDGGKGQINQALDVLTELQVTGIDVVGLAKGPERKSGFETIFLNGVDQELDLDANHPGFLLLQHIRDEAHRFAVSKHRWRRGKARKKSTLEDIEGVGPKRRKAMIQFFGGLQEINNASIDELAKVPGISRALAEEIYANLHNV